MHYFVHLRQDVFTLTRNGREIPQHIFIANQINGKRFNNVAEMEDKMNLPLFLSRVPTGGSPYNILSGDNMCKIINTPTEFFTNMEGNAFAYVTISSPILE